MLRKLISATLAVGLFAVVLSSASAYTMDATGTGFVGKGEVQTAFGWNNQQLQANAAGVTFSYVEEGTLTQTCEREAGRSQIITREFTKVRTINVVVGSSGRNISSGLHGPNTGFILTGFQDGDGGGALPTDICPNSNPNPAENTWHPNSAVVFESTSTGGLYVTVNGVSRLLIPS